MNTAAHTHCLRCGRHLTSAHSTATGYGPTCARKVRTAANVISLADCKATQIASARELIEDGAIIPLRARRIFLTVSSDGSETYRTARQGCTCPAGLKGRDCYHRAAVAILSEAA